MRRDREPRTVTSLPSIRRTVDRLGRQLPRLVHRPRRGRQLGTIDPETPAASCKPPPCTPAPAGASPYCTRRPRRRPRPRPRPPPLDPATGHRPRNRDRPDTRQAAALAELLRDLNATFTPIAKGSCDHASREDRYTPSRTLKDLIRARTARCTAPGCGAHAVFRDLDHTLPYPPASPASATSPPPAAATTDASKPPAGSSPSPNPASCTGPHPPDAATPPSPPFTRPDRETAAADQSIAPAALSFCHSCVKAVPDPSQLPVSKPPQRSHSSSQVR